MLSRCLLVMSLIGLACSVNHTGIHTSIYMHSATRSCGVFRLCYELGRDYSRMSEQSLSLDWDEPKDLDKARRAYMIGCTNGEGESCRALVEQQLYRNDHEREVFVMRAAFYQKPARSAEEIAAEQQEILEKVAKENDEIRDRNRKEAEERNREILGIAQVTVQTAQQMLNQSNTGGGADSAGSGDPCAPCVPLGNAMRGACGDPQSPTCYCAAAKMHECTAQQHGCLQNPQSGWAEAKRMHRASCDMSRTGTSPCGCG